MLFRGSCVWPVLASLAIAGALAPAAAAHGGRPEEPRVVAGVSPGPGLVRTVTVRLSDAHSGMPVRGADVAAAAQMSKPHPMRTPAVRLRETKGGRYSARITFPMAAAWTVRVRVSGSGLAHAGAALPVRIDAPGHHGMPAAAVAAPAAPLPVAVEASLTQRDVVTVAVLWLHGLGAMGWIIGVLTMAVALSTRPGVLAEGARERLRALYVPWGAWLHWACVPVVVGTGIYNLLYVTPFPLVWRPRELSRLAEIPFGGLYEAILVGKLALFAVLLATGTVVLRRTVGLDRGSPRVQRSGVAALGGALGPAGLVYLGVVPAMLALAAALRYVHVLTHVAG